MSTINVTYPPFTFKAAKHRGDIYLRAEDVIAYLRLSADALDAQGATHNAGKAYRELARAFGEYLAASDRLTDWKR